MKQELLEELEELLEATVLVTAKPLYISPEPSI
jgi:hypothetical protein